MVISIIALLMSILLPSLSRARDQSKSVHCLARLSEFGKAIAAYENVSDDYLPPAEWSPGPCNTHQAAVRYGWMEILFEFVYREEVYPFEGQGHTIDFPAQRNVDAEKWAEYFICKASGDRGINAGHYRVYLPFWASGTYALHDDRTFDLTSGPRPTASISRGSISPKKILIGDANDASYRGDGDLEALHEGDDCSYIDAGEANEAGPTGRDGNRFSDRHYGGTNYLFQDLHCEWSTKMRERLAVDWDLNDVADVDIVP